MDMYRMIKDELHRLAGDSPDEAVAVFSARVLTAREAIGETGRSDYPLLKGKEALVEAVFRGARGQAFTDMPGSFEGTIRDVLEIAPDDNFRRAVLVSSLNAVMREAGLITGTVHCRDSEPGECARELVDYVRERFGSPRIAFIGFQPAMIECLAPVFALRVVDLDEDNIGREVAGVSIHGPDGTGEVIEWADIILATGSTCVNATMNRFTVGKPVVFYGISGAGVTKLFGFDRYCRSSH